MKSNRENLYIFDLDGTLNDNHGHFHRGTFVDWDIINPVGHKLYNMIRKTDSSAKIVILTGRSASFFSETLAWLNDSGISIKQEDLIMKPDEDSRSGWQYKTDFVKNMAKKRFRIMFIVEDRLKYARHWRKLGFRCIDIAGNRF